MQLKSEQNIFPDALPRPPEGISYKEFVQWAQQITDVNNQISRQLFDLYNRHLSDALAHPAMWKANRVNRHSFYNTDDFGTSIQFDASATNPLYLITGETRQVTQPQGYKLYFGTENITVDLTTNGINGLNTGLTLTADTPYYLYAVVDNDKPGIIADENDPSVGPTGYNYGEWHYQGAFCTLTSSNTLPKFVSNCGIFITEIPIETKSFAADSFQTVTYNSLPLTAKHAYFQAFATTIIGSTITVNGGALAQTALQPSLKNFIGPSFLMIRTTRDWDVSATGAGGTSALNLRGWIEDPTEWS